MARRATQVFRRDPNFNNYKGIVSLGKGNNSDLIKDIMTKKGWKVQASQGKKDVFFQMKWVQSYNLICYENLFEGN